VTRQTNAIAAAPCDIAASPTQANVIPYAPRRSISTALAQFGAHTASFTSQALGAEWSCFYYLDERGDPFGFQVHRTPWEVRESYVRSDMARSDPLHPGSLVTQNLSFVSVFDRRLSCALESRRTYWNFLSAFGARDAAEMIFRVGGRAVAGMSLLWVGRAGLRADRHLGETLQAYIELNLAAHYGGSPAGSFPDKAPDLALTERELEIVRLVCQGLTNARIAQGLNIGLATVKTHLLHVFEKLNVRTRAELVSRCLAALPAGSGR
jgi:DNA-binding CsgD family transcriptional regulator